MKKTLGTFIMVSVLLLAVAAAAKAETYDLSLRNPTEVGGVQLKAGAYKVALENGALLFYSDREEVANVQVRLEELGKKNPATSWTLNTEQNPAELTSMRFRGATTNMVLQDRAVSAP